MPKNEYSTRKLMQVYPCELPKGVRQNILNLGVSKRHLVDHVGSHSKSEKKMDESVLVDLCSKACKKAIQKANLSVKDIGYFISAYDANPFLSPGLSHLLVRNIGFDPFIKHVNIQGNASTAFPKALEIAEKIKRKPAIPPEEIEEVIMGCANHAGEDNRNVARMALLLAGLPYTVAGETVNRLCASGMAAVINAANSIKLGNGDIYIAGGIEHMTRAPYVISKAETPFGREQKLYDSSFGWRFINPKMQNLFGTESMGETAENLAEKYSISREEQDYFAYHSQMKAKKAASSGRWDEEIVAVEIPQKKGESIFFKNDEFMKPNT
ncbi:MAG: hypothetical protein ACK4TI_05640, partial [Nitrososphaerales archaeon]